MGHTIRKMAIQSIYSSLTLRQLKILKTAEKFQSIVSVNPDY